MSVKQAGYRSRITALEKELQVEDDPAKKMVISSTINSLKSILFHECRKERRRLA